MLTIPTLRLLIRPFTTADLPAFLAYRNDPQVARYQGWDIPYPPEKALAFVEEMQNRLITPGEWLQLALQRHDNGEMIGDIALHPFQSDPRQAYIGITLAQAYWGKGYAQEATRALIEELFRRQNFHRLVAECDVQNTASQALLQRIGFRREAHLVENIWFKGAYGSEYHYALLQKEWK